MIGLFIDGEYARKTFQQHGRIDFLALRRRIEQDLSDQVDEAYYFNADSDEGNSEKLYRALATPYPRGPGLRVKNYWLSKKVLCWPQHLGGGPVMHPTQPGVMFEQTTQKAVDVGLAHNMTRSFFQRRWTNLVLFSGDGDFHEPVQSLVEHYNVNLTLVGTFNSMSEKLMPYARKILDIGDATLAAEIKLKPFVPREVAPQSFTTSR